MTRAERISTHPVFGAMRDTREAADAMSEEVWASANSRGLGGVMDRVEPVIGFVEGAIHAGDPNLIAISTLDEIADSFRSIQNVLAVIPEEDEQWATADNQLDNVCRFACEFATAAGPLKDLTSESKSKLGQLAISRAHELERNLGVARDELAELGGEVDKVGRQAENRNDELTRSSEEWRLELGAAVEGLRSEMEALLSSARESATQAEDERRDAFGSLIERHDERLEEKLAEVDTAASAEREKLETAGQALLEQTREDVTSAFDDVQVVHTKVTELYSVIAQTGTAGAFKDEAEAQSKVANTWRITAIGFGVAAVAAALASVALVLWGDLKDYGVAEVVAKLAVTLGLGAIAGYAARQSARHREREEDARHLQLDLVAIGPFLQDIDDPNIRNQAREQFIQRWMTSRQRPPSTKARDTVAGLDSLTQLVTQLNNRDQAPPAT